MISFQVIVFKKSFNIGKNIVLGFLIEIGRILLVIFFRNEVIFNGIYKYNAFKGLIIEEILSCKSGENSFGCKLIIPRM